MSITNEKIECICCYHQNIIALDAFIQCKADPKHLICQRCFTDWGSGDCFFCAPLGNRPVYIRVPTELTSEIAVHIDRMNNAQISVANIDLSINIDILEEQELLLVMIY